MTILLDGGMGQKLRSRGFNSDANVAGNALLESPETVCDVHREFVSAGAEVITAWNYALTPQRLSLSGQRDQLGNESTNAIDPLTGTIEVLHCHMGKLVSLMQLLPVVALCLSEVLYCWVKSAMNRLVPSVMTMASVRW